MDSACAARRGPHAFLRHQSLTDAHGLSGHKDAGKDGSPLSVKPAHRPFSCALTSHSQGTACLEKQVIAILSTEKTVTCVHRLLAGDQVQKTAWPHGSGGEARGSGTQTYPRTRPSPLPPIYRRERPPERSVQEDSRGERGRAGGPTMWL